MLHWSGAGFSYFLEFKKAVLFRHSGSEDWEKSVMFLVEVTELLRKLLACRLKNLDLLAMTLSAPLNAGMIVLLMYISEKGGRGCALILGVCYSISSEMLVLGR